MAGVLSFPLLCHSDAPSPFKPPLLPQVRTETDTEGGKEEDKEEEEVLLAEEQRPSTLLLLHLLCRGLLFAPAANPSRPRPDPAAPTPNRRWTWTTSRLRSAPRAPGRPAEAPGTREVHRVRTGRRSGRAWPWSCAAAAGGPGRQCT